MADKSLIEWTDATWNPVTGCAVVSPGCTNCYAMRLAGTRLRNHPSRAGLTAETKAGPVWNGKVRLNEGWLRQPLQWKRPRRIFVCAHGDLFAEGVPDAWIDRVFAVMALASQHTFQVLTKRAARMRAYLNDPTTQARVARAMMDLAPIGRFLENAPIFVPGGAMRVQRWPLPNVWLGVSAEDQPRADERVPELLATPAAVRYVSAEPLLGPIDLLPHLFIYTHADDAALAAEAPPPVLPWRDPATTPADEIATPRLDWVIVGGENGPRPVHPDWIRQIRDACATAGVPFFFKQWGSWRHVAVIEGSTEGFIYMAADGVRDDELRRREAAAGSVDWSAWWFENVGKTAAGRILDGQTYSQFPEAA